jgi:hypothetical protein
MPKHANASSTRKIERLTLKADAALIINLRTRSLGHSSAPSMSGAREQFE